MKAIFKYSMAKFDNLIEMPRSAKILCVQVQHTVPTLWVEVNIPDSRQDDPEMEFRKFQFHNTGDALPDNPGTYIGTVLLREGSIVRHIYEAGT